MERAQQFYEAIFQMQMQPMPIAGLRDGGFPDQLGGRSYRRRTHPRAHEMYTPSTYGVVVYLNANPSIQAVIDRIAAAGGEVIMPKTQISPEIGYMALFIDSEGNRMALHAQA